MEFLLHILAGASVGFMIGLTGVGGGSLMTPLLLMFGYPAQIAIGTDLLYAALTKANGAWSQHQRGNVRWKIVLLLAAGSIPTSLALHFFVLELGNETADNYEQLLTRSLGLMLVITGLILVFKEKLRFGAINEKPRLVMNFLHCHSNRITFLMGIVLGICVTLSSVGAGAFCAAVLLTLYSKTPASQIIATDIAHAVPLTLIAGLGYLAAGQVDLTLLTALLVGSLPAIHLGGRISNAIPEKILQLLLTGVLLSLGVYYLIP
ncbi:MAG: sulfite exporter TauE/SafE family protein [Pseudohongiellaceae bacterium]